MSTSCFISSGVPLPCGDGIGGIKSMWVLGLTGATGASVSSVAISGTTGPISGITGAGAWYQFQLKRNTSSLAQNTTKSFENSSLYWEQVLTAVLFKYDQDKRNELLVLGQNDKIQIIAQDQNDVFYYLGQSNGMYLSGGAATSGTAYGDANKFELIFTGQEAQPANTIGASDVAALTSLLTTGGFGVVSY
jgi:hypothetical protein